MTESAESPQAKPPCPECGGVGYYQTEGPGEGGVVLMNCHVCSDGQIIPDPPTTAACPYCGLTDHTGREHLQYVLALSGNECHDCGDTANHDALGRCPANV